MERQNEKQRERAGREEVINRISAYLYCTVHVCVCVRACALSVGLCAFNLRTE